MRKTKNKQTLFIPVAFMVISAGLVGLFYVLDAAVPLGFFILCFIASIVYLVDCYLLRKRHLKHAARFKRDSSITFFDIIGNIDFSDIDTDIDVDIDINP
jgi:hypothetical protein